MIDQQDAGERLRSRHTASRRLLEAGVRIAVDDCGTRCSSLSHLRRLPVDILKIDRAFVSGIRQGVDAAVAHTVVELAHTLGLATLAEGIETPGQAQELLGLGCTHGQGYLFSQPLASARIEELLHWGEQWPPDLWDP